MDDNDFEKMFNSEDVSGHECQKRLLLEAISNRLGSVNSFYDSTINLLVHIDQSEKFIDIVSADKIKSFLNKIIEESEVSINQMDYFISRMIDEIDPDEIDTNEK